MKLIGITLVGVLALVGVGFLGTMLGGVLGAIFGGVFGFAVGYQTTTAIIGGMSNAA